MYFKSVSLFLVALCLASAQSKSLESNQVQLTLLYESLCPFCQQFIAGQLAGTYKKFGSEYINLELIPYGNVKDINVNGTVVKSCQHGDEECYGNKVHGCLLEHNSLEDSLAFLNCSEVKDEPTSDETFEKCSNLVNVSWSKIQSCVKSGEGEKIFLQNGQKTKPFNHEYVPWIVVNGVHDEDSQDAAQMHLEDFVCDLLNNKPSGCQKIQN